MRAKGLTAPHAAALLAMTVQRLDEPASKLACRERWLDTVRLPEAEGLGLYQLYSWVFPGDTPDVTTVARIKDDLRAMRLGRVLFVGDAGLYSKANLAGLAEGAGRYVLATPPARVKEIRDAVLGHPGRYAAITPELEAKEVVIGEGERRRRYVVRLNREEAARQEHRRRRLLEQLAAELEALGSDHPKAACRLVASKRFGPYLRQDEEGRPSIDPDKVRAGERLDGKRSEE